MGEQRSAQQVAKQLSTSTCQAINLGDDDERKGLSSTTAGDMGVVTSRIPRRQAPTSASSSKMGICVGKKIPKEEEEQQQQQVKRDSVLVVTQGEEVTLDEDIRHVMLPVPAVVCTEEVVLGGLEDSDEEEQPHLRPQRRDW